MATTSARGGGAVGADDHDSPRRACACPRTACRARARTRRSDSRRTPRCRARGAPRGGAGSARPPSRRRVLRAAARSSRGLTPRRSRASTSSRAPGVPDGEGEHAVQARHAGRALLLVEVDDRLGVGARAVRVALGLELGAQRLVVVDLAVVGDPDGAVLVGHRLVAGGRQVDDRQPPVAESDRRAAGSTYAPSSSGPRWPARRHSRAVGSPHGKPVGEAGIPLIPHMSVRRRHRDNVVMSSRAGPRTRRRPRTRRPCGRS